MILPLLLLAPAPVQEPPKLVVLLSVDQLIPQQLERLAPELDGGLGRLYRGGTVYRNAMLGHSATETGPGHATLATGCHPRTHGVTGNSFFDRLKGEDAYCVGDDEAGPVPANAYGGKVSTKHLRVPTLADRLRAEFPESRSFSVSGKDRSAVCLGGAHASPAVWWDRRIGGFSSSTTYGPELPDWIKKWNSEWELRAAGWVWEPTFTDAEALGTEPDERPGEQKFIGTDVTFPHVVPDDGDLAPVVFQTPLLDLYCLELATLAVRHLELGKDDAPDVVGLGLSGCDVTGHGFGPYSHEVTDLLLRVDDALGRYFDFLDSAVGEGEWVCVLSSDHGVLPLPEFYADKGVDSGRLNRAQRGEVYKLGADAVKAEFGEDAPRVHFASDGFNIPKPGDIDPARAREVIAEAVAAHPFVEAAYTMEYLAAAPSPEDDGYVEVYRRSYDPERTIGVHVRFRERYLLQSSGTTHGSPYEYDREVPLVFYGPGFDAVHRFDRDVMTVDAVPTVLSRMGLEADGMDGVVR